MTVTVTLDIPKDAAPVRYGPASYVPGRFAAVYDDTELSVVVDILVAAGRHGGPEIDEIHLERRRYGEGSVGLSALDLRVSLTRITAAALEAAARPLVPVPASRRKELGLRAGAFQVPGDPDRYWYSPQRTRLGRGRAPLTNDFLRQVVEAAESRTAGQTIHAAVNAIWPAAPRTIDGWLREARNRKLTPEGSPGRPRR